MANGFSWRIEVLHSESNRFNGSDTWPMRRNFIKRFYLTIKEAQASVLLTAKEGLMRRALLSLATVDVCGAPVPSGVCIGAQQRLSASSGWCRIVLRGAPGRDGSQARQ